MELFKNSCFSSIGLILFVVITQKVVCESMLVTVTETAPSTPGPSVNVTQESEIKRLESKIENLSFNLHYMQEVVGKWQKNFKLINERFIKLENQVRQLSSGEQLSTFPTGYTTTSAAPTTTTTTTNSPRQIQEPDM